MSQSDQGRDRAELLAELERGANNKNLLREVTAEFRDMMREIESKTPRGLRNKKPPAA